VPVPSAGGVRFLDPRVWHLVKPSIGGDAACRLVLAPPNPGSGRHTLKRLAMRWRPVIADPTTSEGLRSRVDQPALDGATVF
jgi:hypothetical protein